MINYFNVKKVERCHFARKTGISWEKVDDLAYFNIFSFQTQSPKSDIFSKFFKIVVSSIDTSKISHDEKFELTTFQMYENCLILTENVSYV